MISLRMKYYICVLQMGFVDILTTNDPIIRHFGLEAAVQVLVLRLAVFIGQIFICLYVAVHIFCIYQTNCESLIDVTRAHRIWKHISSKHGGHRRERLWFHL